MQVDQEPAFPLEALAPCPTVTTPSLCPAAQAERAWWNSVLTWGRAHHDRVARICRWARDLKAEIPEGYCG